MVQEALERIRQERKLTTVTVAHRLSTIVHSDKIVVIADGAIQESGTHKELVEENGIYATLCAGQGLTADAANSTQSFTPGTSSVSTSSTYAKPEADVETALTSSINDDLSTPLLPAEADDSGDSAPDIANVRSRLHQYSKADIVYSILGYLGGLIIGGLPAGEAVLFGMIT